MTRARKNVALQIAVALQSVRPIFGSAQQRPADSLAEAALEAFPDRFVELIVSRSRENPAGFPATIDAATAALIWRYLDELAQQLSTKPTFDLRAQVAQALREPR
jgi:hypothetical protein